MKICVLVKLARDPGLPTRLDAGGHLPLKGSYPVLEPSAAAAFAVADRLAAPARDAGEDVEVLALSVGGPEVEAILVRALELGADRAVRLGAPRWRHLTASTIADHVIYALEVLGFRPDLVLAGDRSVDEGTGTLGPLVAHRLSLPWVTGVASVERDGEALSLLRRRPRGERLELRGTLPAVLCLDPAMEPLEPPSFEDVARAAGTTIEVIEQAFGLPERAPSLRRRDPQGVPVSVPRRDLPASQRIWSLFWGAEEKRGGLVRSLSPEDTAREILDVLRSRGVRE